MAGDSDTSLCFSSLLCQEEQSCLNEQQGYEDNTYIDIVKPYCFVSEDEDKYVENLVKKETCFGSKGSLDDCSTLSQSWLKSARLDAIEWIFNVCFFLYLNFYFYFYFF